MKEKSRLAAFARSPAFHAKSIAYRMVGKQEGGVGIIYMSLETAQKYKSNMLINELLLKAYSAKNREEIFDSLCFLEMFIQNNNSDIFFEKKVSRDGKYDFSVLKDEYGVKNLDGIFLNKVFLDNSQLVLRYFREHKESEIIPAEVLQISVFPLKVIKTKS